MRYFVVLLLFLINYSCQENNNKMINIGHRGAMGLETENTIASIQKALDLGVDMIEIDVFLLKSGEVVVFHDDTLDSLTNATGRIEDYTFDQLKKITVQGHHIPTLQQVIETIDQKVPLNIELKGKNTAKPTHQIVSDYIHKKWKKDDFIISSFLWNELIDYRNLDSKIAIAVLTEENPLDAISAAQSLNAKAINPWFKNLTQNQVNQIHEAGFKIFTYTVNTPEDLKKMQSWGVDGVFCNYPDIFAKVILQ